MKKTIGLAASFLLVFGAQSAFADFKVGILNLSDIMEHSKRMQSISNDLKKQFEPTRTKIVAEEKSLNDLKEKFNKDSSNMNEKQKADMANKIVSQQKSLQQMEQGFLTKVQDKRTATLNEINSIVAKVAEEGKLDLVLQSNNVVYASKSLDITSKVLSQFDGKK